MGPLDRAARRQSLQELRPRPLGRADNHRIAGLLGTINDAAAAAATAAERTLLQALGGGCSLPLGAHAELTGEILRLRAILLAPDGSSASRADRSGPITDLAAIARIVAADLAGLL